MISPKALPLSENLGIAGDFWRWWRGELLLACGAKPKYLAGSSEGLEISITREGLQLNPSGEAGDLDELVAALLRLKSSGGARSNKIALCLSKDRYVERPLASVKLPGSTARRMAQLDVEAATPFSLSDVHMCLEEEASEFGTRRYFLIKRAVIEPLRVALKNNGFELSRVLVEAEHEPVQISGLCTSIQHKWRGMLTALLATATILLMALSSAFLWQAAHTANRTLGADITRISEELKDLKPEFQNQRKVETLAHEMEARRDVAFSTTAVLIALTISLPDGTYIERLVVKKQGITIAGYSDDAPPLIAKLEDSPLLTNVAFSGPMNKVPGKIGNRFEITASIER